LQQLGILRESGHGRFNGLVVIPIFDSTCALVEMYGRKITPNLRGGRRTLSICRARTGASGTRRR
jgi:hypothetical protein